LIFGDSAKRRRVRQEFARIAASLFGDFPISEDHKLWRSDTDFLDKYKMLSPNNPYSQDRKYSLREFSRLVKNIPGEIAECGCYEGASAYFLALENPDVSVHIFDSFEGLSDPLNEDRTTLSGQPGWQKGDLACSKEKTREILKPFNNIVIHKGWIPEKFDEVSDRRFRFVHIDVDLYQPTKDSLQFFPRMIPGGVIIMDDYGFTNCPGAFRAASEFMSNKPEYIVHLPTGQGLIIVSGDQSLDT
jgi:hypothetical protein